MVIKCNKYDSDLWMTDLKYLYKGLTAAADNF